MSISTVSNVLNRSKYVSPELIKRVEDAVRELTYEANPIARSMKNNRSGMIGVITEDMCGLFYPYVVKGINSVVSPKGYQLVIYDCQGTYGKEAALERERAAFRKLFASRVDGIIFVSAVHEEEKRSYFEHILHQASLHKKIHIVSVERDFSDVGIDSVYFDGYENTKMAVQHLIDCGCRKIGHITGPSNLQIAQDRVRGFRDCMAENSLSVRDGAAIADGDYSHQSGYIAMKQLLERMPDIDGVFCGNDQMAVGALKALKERGKRVPDEIKLIGYDDAFLYSVVEPSISTIHVPKRHTGILAAEILLKKIETESAAQESVKSLKMGCSLVARKSTVARASEDWIFSEW